MDTIATAIMNILIRYDQFEDLGIWFKSEGSWHLAGSSWIQEWEGGRISFRERSLKRAKKPRIWCVLGN